LYLTKFLTEKMLKSSENEFDSTIMVVVDAWNHINFTCKNYILNRLDNTLYNMYSLIKSGKKTMKMFRQKVQS